MQEHTLTQNPPFVDDRRLHASKALNIKRSDYDGKLLALAFVTVDG